ncbi:hypothetical protein P154DRAFT_432576 [Amniculicola lignicola CBS 123094]|uniref:Aminoglycoside phosphotransferase domain-containing protein n=1 Tax=Amniculicola lignicola CBS 123094 TaxID=1392246 RepID=A0A6A5WRF2_9PLEO|nr:hypothetical protein P154DRAFT_432576 [Amniculicola lignicola CBS 123094]
MAQATAATAIANSLLATAGLQLDHIELVQSLWAGYGYIYRLTAIPSTNWFVLKLIAPPPAKRSQDEGNARKTLSYRVEHYFYTHLAPQLPASIAVAKCIANINEEHIDGTSTTALIMTDLQQNFPIAGESRAVLSPTQVDAALEWLASFHGFWRPRVRHLDRLSMLRPPLQEMPSTGARPTGVERTVWLNGGYTYLATRRSEYRALASDHGSEWKQLLTEPDDVTHTSIADMVAAILAPSPDGNGPWEEYQTIIHGDVKSENLFTNRDGTKVAFYDFQYVGLGLGVSDLAKLFTVSVPMNLLVGSAEHVWHELGMQPGEEMLLKHYVKTFSATSQGQYDWSVFKQHWEMALVDWLRFQASWGFWGNTEWLEARVRHILRDGDWQLAVRDGYKAIVT